MTQIKLRRDTSANFASKNPVLGLGEPAYETDTKKLKIGDGTTAYTQLEYFSAGGGGSADIGAVLPLKIVNGVISLEVDGQTIQVVDGKLAASTNMVTTNTTQTITGNKTFSSTINGNAATATKATQDGNGNNIVNTYATKTSLNTKADTSLSNLTDAGKQVIKDNSGSGLEVCDIGMALYVDETKGLRRYLNGQIVDINTNTQAFLNRLKDITILHPSLLCTEEEWQTAKTMSAFGQVGKFVFNYSGDKIVSVRLPRVVNVQGLFDLQNLGMTVVESLPNIKGSIGGLCQNGASGKGAFSNAYSVSNMGFGNNVVTTYGTNFDASRSSSTYKDNAPVQQEAIQYPYFIQIATGSETEANIINTLENVNGFTLLESKYSDKPLYNECWLLSNGQWNAKAVYPTVYEALQVEYNSQIEVGTTVTLPSGVSYTKRGLSVKLSTEEYTDYDFVLNTADETFRLPLKTKLASGKAVAGNGMSLGLFDAKGSYFGIREGQNSPTSAHDAYGVLAGSTSTGSDYAVNNTAWGVTTDPTKSGIELSDSGLYLYFYVGDLDQNHGIVNMGRIGEQLADKIGRTECKAYITETYVNGTSGYRIWSDGYCEQWGQNSGATNAETVLLKQYSDTTYNISLTFDDSSNGNRNVDNRTKYIAAYDATKFYVRQYNNANNAFHWKTCGYLTQGEY